MVQIDAQKIDETAINYFRLKTKANKNPKFLSEFNKYRNDCIPVFDPIIVSKIRKYKKFANYEDLYQDGREALLLALNSFDPTKGSFISWATYYIKTRISRCANAHSVIKFPMEFAKNTIPRREFDMPIVTDPCDNCQILADKSITNSDILDAVKELSPIHQKVVCLTYGLNNCRENTVENLIKELNISQSQYVKLMKESKRKLKCLLIKYK